jgi:hypothetical protein
MSPRSLAWRMFDPFRPQQRCLDDVLHSYTLILLSEAPFWSYEIPVPAGKFFWGYET